MITRAERARSLLSRDHQGFSVAFSGSIEFGRGQSIVNGPHPATILLRQTTSFVGVGLVATLAHYAVLIALVQGAAASPVPATLVGFCVGGVLSYRLNRRHTFASERPHRQTIWRFAVVAAVGFLLTAVAMAILVDHLLWPYLLAQIITTGCVMMWTFSANRAWTFAHDI